MKHKILPFLLNGVEHSGVLFIHYNSETEMHIVVVVLWIDADADGEPYYLEHEMVESEDCESCEEFISGFGYPEAAKFMEEIEFTK